MGAGNRSYQNTKTGGLVTAARIVRTNLKVCRAIAGVRATGDAKNERYAVSAASGDIPACPGDWAIVDADGKASVMSHADFAAAHVPAPPKDPA